MANRGRGFMSGGVWDGEYDSQSLIDLDARLKTVEASGETGSNTLTGVPQCANPFMIADRVEGDGKHYVSLRFVSVGTDCRRIWVTLRKVKRNGLYGKELREDFRIEQDHRDAGEATFEWPNGLPPNFTWDCVRIEAKLTNADDDDGGSRDQIPDPYTSLVAPNGTQLGRFVTGTAQAGGEVANEILNSKFRYSHDTWDDDGGGGGANRLAKWRFGFATAIGGNSADSIVANTVSTARNYWGKTGHFLFGTTFIRGGVLVLFRGGGIVSIEDVCARLQKRPFDPGEPFHVQLSRLTARSLTSFDPAVNLIATLEDSSAGVIATTTFVGINQTVGPFNWEPVRFPETTVSESYLPATGSQQWVRLRLSQSLSQAAVVIDKVSASHMAGAYQPNSRDRQQTADSDVVDTGGGSGRGPSGYGRTGGESPAGAGGQIILPVTD